MSACPSASIRAASTGRISVKFDVGTYENLSGEIQICLKSDKNVSLHHDLRRFMAAGGIN